MLESFLYLVEVGKEAYTEQKLQMNPNEDKDIKSVSGCYSILVTHVT